MSLQVLVKGCLVSPVLLTWFPSGRPLPVERVRVRSLTTVMLGVPPYNLRDQPLQGFVGMT